MALCRVLFDFANGVVGFGEDAMGALKEEFAGVRKSYLAAEAMEKRLSKLFF